MKQRWIVKIGSALLTNYGEGVDTALIKQWTQQIVTLKDQYDIEIIIVSSGAIVAGIKLLNWNIRPNAIEKLQAAAAVGQMDLIQCYQSCFTNHQHHSAQILVTHYDIDKKPDNISATLNTLLSHHVTPIVNENDTVATDEIRFGDNDTLAAQIATLTKADKLIILTDQQGVYTKDPRHDNDAQLINSIAINDPNIDNFAIKTTGHLGRGGMYTKILAAKQACQTNTTTHIVYGREDNVLLRLQQNESIGTLIYC